MTGVGLVTPVGRNIAEVWSSMTAGRSGVGWISLFDASSFPSRTAGEVKDADSLILPEDRERFKYAGRNIHFAVAAARTAMEDSGILVDGIDPTRFGVYLGSGEGQQDLYHFMNLLAESWDGQRVHTDVFFRGALARLHAFKELEQEPSMPSAHLANLFDARGPNGNCLTACAASSQAMGEAFEIIRRGDADAVISGGDHSMIHPLGVTGFVLLTALSTRSDDPTKGSRPFDRMRDGFILGEGAGIVILEELERARRRGARIYGELTGYGSTGDAFRITDTHPDGRGAVAAMKGAMADARINPEDIDYINAHGTSTVVNDRIETMAIKKTFGDRAYHVPVSSIKGMIGHLIAAAGAVEMVICLKAIAEGVIPPTINYEYPDPECDLDYVPNQAREKHMDTVLSNSFGFGGQNICLVIRRYDGS